MNESKCCHCEAKDKSPRDWSRDGYVKLVKWHGHTFCTDCREDAQGEMIQAKWENNNGHIWNDQN